MSSSDKSAGEPGDELNALIHARSWLLRRVDRLEFVDLTSVRRTIVFTLDLAQLSRELPTYQAPPASGVTAFPLGLFRRDAARAGTRLEDAAGSVVAHLSRPASDALVRAALEARLAKLGLHKVAGLLDHVQSHSLLSCELLMSDSREFDGYADLASEKWGCPAVGMLLQRLRDAEVPKTKRTELEEVVRLLFDWQNNYVLFVPFQLGLPAGERSSSVELPPEFSTLVYSYSEELRMWRTPWDRRRVAIGRNDLGQKGKAERMHVARPPFRDDLDKLRPTGLPGWLASRRSLGLRRLGRRGAAWTAWHVAWLQASSRDVGSHVVEVTLPADLAVIRLRMIERWLVREDQKLGRRERVAAAGLNRSRAATLPVPPLRRDEPRGSAYSPPASPLSEMLMSLVVAQQRESGPWLAGIAAAAATGIAVLVGAATELPQLVAQGSTVVTILLLAPALVSALLSVRAASAIGQELTQTLRTLITLIGILSVACAISLAIQPAPPNPPSGPAPTPHLVALRIFWIAAGALLIAVAAVLASGWSKLGRQLDYRDIQRSGQDGLVANGYGLIPEDRRAPRIPPPDGWIESGEGDRIPWGWLWVDPDGPKDNQSLPDGQERKEDLRYWDSAYPRATGANRNALIDWRQLLFIEPLQVRDGGDPLSD